MLDTDERAVVGVAPAWERSARARLFDAFERAYPVVFEGREIDQLRGADESFLFPSAGDQPAPAHIASLFYSGEERKGDVVEDVQLADSTVLARPLRQATLTEAYAAGAPLVGPEAGEVLATVGGRTAWRGQTTGGVAHRGVSIAPLELAERDALRSRLTPTRSLAVLASWPRVRPACHSRSGLADAWDKGGIRNG